MSIKDFTKFLKLVKPTWKKIFKTQKKEQKPIKVRTPKNLKDFADFALLVTVIILTLSLIQSLNLPYAAIAHNVLKALKIIGIAVAIPITLILLVLTAVLAKHIFNKRREIKNELKNNLIKLAKWAGTKTSRMLGWFLTKAFHGLAYLLEKLAWSLENLAKLTRKLALLVRKTPEELSSLSKKALEITKRLSSLVKTLPSRIKRQFFTRKSLKQLLDNTYLLAVRIFLAVFIGTLYGLAPVIKKLAETPGSVKTGVKLMLTNRDYRLFGIIYFVQGILGLSGLAFTFYLNDVMKLSVVQITTLTSITMIPWTIKPLYGMISDSFPLIKGLRRKPYIILGCLTGSIGWFIFLKGAFALSYSTLIIGMTIEAVGIAFTDVVCDGLAVQKSPTEEITKAIQNICWGSRAIGALIGGFGSGWLCEHNIAKDIIFFIHNLLSQYGYGYLLKPHLHLFSNAYITIFMITMILPLLPFISAFLVSEDPVEEKNKVGFKHSLKVLGTAMATKRNLMIAAFFIFIWNLSQISFGTPFTIFMKTKLGFSEPFIGTLITLNSVGSLAGMLLYGLYLQSVTLKKILKWTIIIGAASTLTMFLILNPTSAMIVYLIGGIISYVAFIPTMSVAVLATPKDAEASVYALLMSIANLGSNVVATYLGGHLYEIIGLRSLILLAAATSLLPLLVLNKLDKLKGEDKVECVLNFFSKLSASFKAGFAEIKMALYNNKLSRLALLTLAKSWKLFKISIRFTAWTFPRASIAAAVVILLTKSTDPVLMKAAVTLLLIALIIFMRKAKKAKKIV